MTMTQTRLPWFDAFNEPTPQDLRRPYDADRTKLFDAARTRLSGVGKLTEKMVWFGDGWHWSIGYLTPKQDEPAAIIIPNPEDLQLAMPLNRDFLGDLDLNQVKKSLREGLELAREPFETHWGIWSIDQVSLIDDVIELLEARLLHDTKSKA